mmetsp:Transcript_51172/g.51586  ORF Transcript_51172/g.51586 Transcript_51172/m.51586 type:complete len:131 (-) Transcript_51172:91-483(-)
MHLLIILLHCYLQNHCISSRSGDLSGGTICHPAAPWQDKVRCTLYRKNDLLHTKSPIFVGWRWFPIVEYFLEEWGSKLQFGAKEQKQIQEVLSNCLKRKCATALNVQSIGILHHLAVPIATAVGSDTSSE